MPLTFRIYSGLKISFLAMYSYGKVQVLTVEIEILSKLLWQLKIRHIALAIHIFHPQFLEAPFLKNIL